MLLALAGLEKEVLLKLFDVIIIEFFPNLHGGEQQLPGNNKSILEFAIRDVINCGSSLLFSFVHQ